MKVRIKKVPSENSLYMQDGGKAKKKKGMEPLPKYVRNPAINLEDEDDYKNPSFIPPMYPEKKPLKQLSDLYHYYDNLLYSGRPKTYRTDTNTINLTQGKMRGATVNTEMLDDLIRAADKNGIPRDQMLAIAANESMFGKGYAEDMPKGTAYQDRIVSAWNVDSKYGPITPYDFLYQKGVPNIKSKAYFNRVSTVPTNAKDFEKSADSALAIHPEWVNQYDKLNVNKVTPKSNIDYFDEIAQQLKSGTIDKLNPGHIDYTGHINRMQQSVAQDKAIQDYYKKYDKNKNTMEKTYKVKLKSGGKLSSDKAKEILRDGTAQGHPLTAKQKRYFGYIAGGGTPKANNGASISQLSENPQSNGIFQFNGPSHENNGIPINYEGQNVEVEGDETGFIDKMGDLNVFGNMYVPGTNKKFKSVSKEIAKQEVKADKQASKASKLMNEASPYDKYERFKFNSGMVMGVGAAKKQQQLTDSKEFLSNLQEAMLYAGYGDDTTKKAQDGKKVIKNKTNTTANNPIPIYDPRYFNQFTGEGQILSQYAATNPIPIVDDPNQPIDPSELTNTERALGKASGRNSSVAVRHNNPGNMKYAPWMKKYGAVPGQAGTDGGQFAQFPTIEAGQSAMINLLTSSSYKGKTVTEAIKRWTGGTPYSKIPADIKGKKVSDLNPGEFKGLLDTITQGEDSKKYNWSGITPAPPTQAGTPSTNVTANPPNLPVQPYSPNLTPYTPQDQNPPRRSANPEEPNIVTGTPLRDIVPPTNRRNPYRNPLAFSQIAPEIFTLATERPGFVPGQTYEPNLYQPYQVSFQDRLNENNASFRAMAQQLPGNAAALSVLAGQKYQADNQVQADEFRTNQAIANDITNKNTELLNQARMTNIGLTDQQFVRQEQARANTRENIRNAMNSVAAKMQQNRTETARYNAYANLFPQYSFDRRGTLEYIPNEDMIFGDNMIAPSSNPAQRTRTTYDKNGEVKQVITTLPSAYQTAAEQARAYNQELRQRMELANQIRGSRRS